MPEGEDLGRQGNKTLSVLGRQLDCRFFKVPPLTKRLNDFESRRIVRRIYDDINNRGSEKKSTRLVETDVGIEYIHVPAELLVAVVGTLDPLRIGVGISQKFCKVDDHTYSLSRFLTALKSSVRHGDWLARKMRSVQSCAPTSVDSAKALKAAGVVNSGCWKMPETDSGRDYLPLCG